MRKIFLLGVIALLATSIQLGVAQPTYPFNRVPARHAYCAFNMEPGFAVADLESCLNCCDCTTGCLIHINDICSDACETTFG